MAFLTSDQIDDRLREFYEGEPAPLPSPWRGVRQAARYCGLPVSTIRLLMKQRLLPHRKGQIHIAHLARLKVPVSN